ncbi:MAG TPA: helix-turn-helix transcriptional regulator, partial [Polyangiaceae bacterium]
MATSKAKSKASRKITPRPTVQGTSGDELGAADMAKQVAETLKVLRRDRHLSLDDLASRSGVSRAAL